MKRDSGKTLLGIIAGAALGFGAGLLLAPDEGKKTREKINKSLKDTTNDLKKKVSDLEKKVKSKSSKAKESLEDKIENMVAKGSDKAEDVINVLEKKLSALKEANTKLKK